VCKSAFTNINYNFISLVIHLNFLNKRFNYLIINMDIKYFMISFPKLNNSMRMDFIPYPG
jgi:hypothetical protein